MACALAWQADLLSNRGLILAGLVSIWSGRLGAFLVTRVHRVGKDARFDDIKHNTCHFLMAWTLQALWAFLASLPVLIILTANVPATPLGIWDVLGCFCWVVGFGIEVVADRQKEAFRARHPSGERWIDEGLWSQAQHPNYFGEILLWTGVFITGFSVYEGMEWLSAVSPVFVAFTVLGMSGIPMIRARNRVKWGQEPAYQAYLDRTNVLFPYRP